MSGLFAPKPQPLPPPPEVKPPAPIPDPNGPAMVEANRKKQMDIMSRAGRTSTILTAPEERGGAYAGRKLGSAA